MFKFYSEVLFPKYYDRFVNDPLFNEIRIDLLAQCSGKVLDIGIGTGLNLPYYPETVDKIFGIDPNPGMQRELEKKSNAMDLSLEFHLCGAEELPFEDETFDYVVSTLVLCSIPKLELALEEVARVLKKMASSSSSTMD